MFLSQPLNKILGLNGFKKNKSSSRSIREGDKGETAFLVISGGLVAEIKGKKIGKIETGEIFGELSLILNENRTASIKAIVPSEIVEIKKKALEAILLSSNIDLHKVRFS